MAKILKTIGMGVLPRNFEWVTHDAVRSGMNKMRVPIYRLKERAVAVSVGGLRR